MQAPEFRIRCVEQYIKMFKPKAQVTFHTLKDVAGPTREGFYDGVVLTHETLKGGLAINEMRRENKL